MAVVGSAEVVVRAITAQVKRDIEKAFKDAMPTVKAQGDAAGKAWGDSFGKAAGSSVQNSLDQALGRVDARGSGERAGRDFAVGAAGGMGSGAGGIGSAAESAFGGAGRRGGNAFTRALNSAWADSAVAASRAFTSIYAMANIGGTAISGLVSAVSTLVSGLFTMASAASVAAGALAVLPGIMAAAMQAGGALKLAFSGVGAALTAGLKPATAAVNSAGGAAVSNANAIADAQRNLQRAYQDAARARFDADRRVADAARGVAEAESELLGITRQLNDARREAAETLQQLAFSAEDAALAEDRAKLNLEDAYTAYMAVKDLPADDKSRREAELSYKEAELAYRQAKDRNADLAKEQKKAAKAGIEGSDEVLSVKQQIAEAEDRLADQERALSDARMQRQRTIADNEQKIADAKLALARAQQQANQSMAAGAKTADAYATAMSQLSPAAQEFVRYLVSIQDEMKGLKAAAGELLFPRLQQAIEPIVNKLFPVFENQLRRTGGILGNYAIGLSNAVTRGTVMRDLMKSQNDTLSIFNRRGDNGRTVIDDLATVTLRLLQAIQPLTQRFARWVAGLIEGWEAATNTKKEMRELTGFFDKAGDRAALLGDILKNAAGVLVGLGKAGDKSGEGLLKSLNKWLEGLNKFVNSDEGRKKLETYFDGVATNMRAIGNMTRAIGRAFGALGDNPGVANFANGITPAIENFGKVIDQMTGAGGGLATLLNNLSELAVVLADTGGIQIFFDVLNGALKPVVAFATSDFGSKFLIIAGTITAVLRAVSFLGQTGNKVFKILAGGPIALMRAFQNLRTKGLSGAIKGLLGIKPASDSAKTALEQQMRVDALKVKSLQSVERQAILTAGALNRFKTAAAPAAGQGKAVAAPATSAATKAAITGAAVPVVPSAAAANTAKTAAATSRMGKVAGVASKGIGGLAKGFGALSMGLLGVSGPVAAVIGGIVLLVIGLKKLYSASPEFKKFVDNIVDKLKALGEWFKEILNKYVVPFFDGLFKWVNDVLPKVGAKFSEIFGKIWNAVAPVLQRIGQIIGVVMPFVWKVVQTYLTVLFTFWKTVFSVIWKVVQVAFNLIKAYVQNILVPTIKVIWKVIQVMWGIAKRIFNALKEAVRIAFQAIKAVWQNVLRPVIEALKSAFQSVRDKVGVVIGFMIDRWNNFKRNMGIVRDFIGGVVEKMKGFFQAVWDKVVSVVTGVVSRFNTFKTNLGLLGEKVGNVVGDIKDFFAQIPGFIRDAFSNLGSKAVGGINAFIRFINSKLIGNINKITSKFGLEIGTIPEITGFAKGGYTGNISPRAVAGVVHGDEHVIRSKARRQIESAAPGVLDYMNRTGKVPGLGTGGIDLWPGDAPDLGLGKLKDLAGEAIGGIKDIGEKIAKEGLGKVLEQLVKGAQGLMSGAGIKRGSFMNDLFYGIMDKLAEYARAWGGKSGEQPGGKIADTGSYNGPPGGWTSPLRGRFPITQYANGGHSPPWAIDIGSPGGSVVQAVSRGRIAYTRDLGGTSYGKYMVIDHGGGVRSLYAHLQQFVKTAGEVLTGQTIALSGNTGGVRGAGGGYHLHFELTPGADTLAELRKRGVRLAKGGVAQATPGGVLSLIAEAGQHERVEPLDSEGMSKRDRAMIELIQRTLASGNGGGGDTFHVHPAPGMDEAALAQMVSRRVAWRRSVGT